jgi:hypothetical protein
MKSFVSGSHSRHTRPILGLETNTGPSSVDTGSRLKNRYDTLFQQMGLTPAPGRVRSIFKETEIIGEKTWIGGKHVTVQRPSSSFSSPKSFITASPAAKGTFP